MEYTRERYGNMIMGFDLSRGESGDVTVSAVDDVRT